MTSNPPVIVWFRRDLRLVDNPAWLEAAQAQRPIIPLFVIDSEQDDRWPPGSASRYWLHQALTDLQDTLHSHSSRLVIRQGPAKHAIPRLIEETGAMAVYWNRRYEPISTSSDNQLKKALRFAGIQATSFNGALLREPWEISTGGGQPYRVFTPYSRHYQRVDLIAAPVEEPKSIMAPEQWPESIKLEDLKLEPKIGWAESIAAAWKFCRRDALDRLTRFLEARLRDYSVDRDRPDLDGVSRLSPYLHFGQLGAREIWHAILDHERDQGRVTPGANAQAFLRQLVWRDFAHHLLFHFPRTSDRPLREDFEQFPWRSDKAALEAWQQGRTGYPIVDAGMRQLWQTGWMHNRVRMIAASFLVKDLLISWRDGARWFWDTLVDADLANNTLGWQWVAGSGADAAPYFRIFNPTTQGKRFDPDGKYVRHWIPELKELPDAYIHEPWHCDKNLEYPLPIVDHSEARQRALAAYKANRKS
jgi:deoxyribodipyrimidine photo-lyase